MDLKVLYLFIFLGFHYLGFSQYKNEEELKKAADKAFDEEEYVTAYKLYSQLVSNNQNNAQYNYRVGVSMLFSEPDKKKALPYLDFGYKHVENCDKEVIFYLGKYFHLNYRFDDAIKYYNEFKLKGSSSDQKRLQVDHEIQACKNGKRLLSNLTELVVTDKKTLAEADYYRSYDINSVGGKLLVKPEEFKTSTDKRKKDKSIVYLPKSNEKLFFASYGDGGDKGKDIFIVRKLPNGTWSKPENLGAPINTEYDEDYPFLHPNGKVLYFASKGHNTMGGYDLFKSELDPSTNRWKAPVNLDFPINSTDDDILFVTDSLEKTAFFSSGRFSVPGKIEVFRINTERRPAEYAYIKGNVIKKTEGQAINSRIKVKNIESGEDEGTFAANEKGEYSMQISNGGKFIFTVETPGFQTQSEGVNIPQTFNLKPYRQLISYEAGKLVITNQFEAGDNTDDSYMQYLEIIEKKSRLDVNAGDFASNTNENQNTVATNANNTNTTNNNPNTSNSTVKNNNLNTDQLIKVAYEDAKELKEEAAKLKTESDNAFDFANSKAIEAQTFEKESLAKMNEANTESNPGKKNELTAIANDKKEQAENSSMQSMMANNFAKQLGTDAQNKEREADLTLKYAQQLEEANKTKNNKEALQKLEGIQKELELASQTKSQSNELANSIKLEASKKDEEVGKTELKSQNLKKEIDFMTEEMATIDKEIAEAKDDGMRDNLKAQKEELAVEKQNKINALDANNDKLTLLKKESEALKSQSDFANNLMEKVKSGDAVATNSTNNVNNNTQTVNENPTNNNITTNNTQQKDVLAKIGEDKNNLNSSLEKINTQAESADKYKSMNVELNNYLNNVNTAIQALNTNLQSEKNATKKKELNNKITELNNEKNAINSQIAGNSRKADELNAIATNNNTNNQNQTDNNANSNTNPNENNNTQAIATNTVNPSSNKTNAITDNNTNQNNANNTISTSEINSALPEVKTNSIAQSDPKNVDELKNLSEQNKNNSIEESKLFTSVNYNNAQAKQQKDEALQVFNSALSFESQIQDKITQAIADEGSAPVVTADNILLQQINTKKENADQLAVQAIQLRKQAKSQNGTEKEATLKKAGEIETEANAIKLEAAQELTDYHKQAFENNKLDMALFIDKAKTTPNADATKAMSLLREGDELMAQGNRLREEANAEPNIGAKIGAFSNADEKEMAAVKKQEEAIALFKKAYPELATGGNETAGNTIDNNKRAVKDLIAQENNKKSEAFAKLAEANKTEANGILLKVSEAEKKKPLNNENYNQLKQKSRAQINEANALLIQANNENEAERKKDLFMQANRVLESAVVNGDKALEMVLGKSVVAVNNIANNSVVAEENGQTVVETAVNTPNGTIPAAEVVKIKESQEYKDYTKLNSETKRLNEQVITSEEKANESYAKATDLLKQSNDVRIVADKMKDGPEKEAQLNRVIELETQAVIYKGAGDSLSELAANTKGLLSSKNQELENIRANAGPQKIANYDAVANAARNTTSVAANNPTNNNPNNTIATNPANNISVANNAKYSDYSPEFKSEANRLDQELQSLNGNDNVTLQKQNNVLQNYVLLINRELDTQNQFLANEPSQEGKNSISQRISNLRTMRDEKESKLNSNNQKLNAVASNPVNNENSNTEPVNTNPTNNQTNNAANTNTNQNTNTVISPTEFEVKPKTSYSNKNPIPINSKLPEGLVFRVQIGAFRNAINPETFKGLSPIGGEQTPEGLIRYQAGMFNRYEKANAIKNDLKKYGYNDAFVVAYYNGKRITIAEALKMMADQGTPVDLNANTQGLPANANIPVNPNPTPQNLNTNVAEATDLATVNGMVFTIQIGVYSSRVSESQLYNLKPVFVEKTPNGTYRYTAGAYNNIDKVKADREKVTALGINDAFVSAYLNGQRIKITDALAKLASGEGVQFPPENPIRFNNASRVENSPAVVNPTPAPATNANNVEGQPFSNGVTTAPAPTAENGVKTDNTGITYKVQIGAYRNKVPDNVAAKFLQIRDWPIANLQVNGLYIYTVGSFGGARFAKDLQKKLVQNGIADAFVVVFKDGKKLFGTEAAEWINKP